MPDDKYNEVVREYLNGLSIAGIAGKVHVSQVKVQRILITEGLWTSKRTEQIAKMRAEGMSVQEIASFLDKDIKTIETFLPYSKGHYGVAESDEAKRAKDYRTRKVIAAENMAKEQSEMEELEKRSASALYNEWNKHIASRKIELKKNPFQNEFSVYRVSFNLCGGFYYGASDDMDLDADDRSILLHYAKAKEGIRREVLLPGDMNLHALHYLIQRLFGWQNCHLHHFALRNDDFLDITEGTVSKWLSMCGKLFRFPSDDMDDLYWDDDYSGDVSVKNWLKSKYRAPYKTKAKADTLEGNAESIQEFKNHFPDLPENMTLEELTRKIVFESDFNTLMESLTLHDLLPAFGDFFYLYDYGDDWCVHITMLDKYDRKTSADLSDSDFFVIDIMNETDGLTKYRYFENKDDTVNEVEEELRRTLAEVDVKSKPLCTSIDGLNVLDDVGGIRGYLDFLRIVNGDASPEKAEYREWARDLGWTGKFVKPEKML